MLAPINIITIVDVLKALSNQTLNCSLYMMDNSWNSAYQGTANLATACYPGQQINWIIHAIDLQTPVLIASITFLDVNRTSFVKSSFDDPLTGTTPHWYYWTGIVPYYLPCDLYRYSLKLQMGRGNKSILYTDTPALNVIMP